jgi:hypothetical protein
MVSIDNAIPTPGNKMNKQAALNAIKKPNANQISAARALMLAMAHEQTVRPIVEAYRTAILAKGQWRRRADFVAHGEADEVILDQNLSYHLAEDDAKIYYAECNKARDAAGLKVDNPEACPLCVAENLRVQAETALIKTLGDIPGMETFKEKLFVLTLDQRAKLVKLALGMCAPFVGNAADILNAA